MASTNNITGDSLQSKVTTDSFRKGFDGIDWSVKLEDDKPQEPKPETKNIYVPLMDK